ncbi:MAG TPA: rhodanese-like domain-containing protein, partial [Anaerolineae bacterium]
MNDQSFVDSAWVQQHLNDPQVRIIDARASDPRLPVGYRMGHIPNAIQLDLGRDLYEFKGRLPELKAPEQMAQVLGERGIANDHSVVIYDEATGQLVAT